MNDRNALEPFLTRSFAADFQNGVVRLRSEGGQQEMMFTVDRLTYSENGKVVRVWRRVTGSFSLDASAAAFSVNVNATMFSGLHPPPPASLALRRLTTRRATTSVLPDPAHAMS